jgi:lipid-A-disaccharide synthase
VVRVSTVWAWRSGRVKPLAKYVDRLLCILPFEEPFLKERGVNATYVGNPVVEQIPAPGPPGPFRAALGLEVDRPVLALLPGSRRSEITRILPVLLDVARRVIAKRPGIQIAIPVAPSLDRQSIAQPVSSAGLPALLVDGRAPEVVGASDVAVVASGTATLEAGLMQRPLVAVYRMNPLSYAVGRALVRLPAFCLVNLLAEAHIVPELLQGEATPERIVSELEPLWEGPRREQCLADLERVRQRLGPPGAAERAAAIALELIGSVE